VATVLEYAEKPAAFLARTRYVYVVARASPVSVNVVAVPASVATCTKALQPSPVQRSTLTCVWLIAPFVHVRPMELRESAVAVRLVGALGRGREAVTTTERVAVPDAPPLSVTVRVAAWVPGVEYTCVVWAPVPEAPSPNDHAHDVTVPSGSVDADPLKLTARGATPVVGVADRTAVGGRLTATADGRQHVMRAS
jgi:hypothetical protein